MAFLAPVLGAALPGLLSLGFQAGSKLFGGGAKMRSRKNKLSRHELRHMMMKNPYVHHLHEHEKPAFLEKRKIENMTKLNKYWKSKGQGLSRHKRMRGAYGLAAPFAGRVRHMKGHGHTAAPFGGRIHRIGGPSHIRMLRHHFKRHGIVVGKGFWDKLKSFGRQAASQIVPTIRKGIDLYKNNQTVRNVVNTAGNTALDFLGKKFSGGRIKRQKMHKHRGVNEKRHRVKKMKGGEIGNTVAVIPGPLP